MDDKSEFLNFITSMADFVSRDEKSVDEYLKEEQINFDEIIKNNIDDIFQQLSSYKLSLGKSKRQILEEKFKIFKEKIKGKLISEIQDLYPSIPKIAYRKFQEDNLEQEEIDDLMMDASFLSFLENEFENK